MNPCELAAGSSPTETSPSAPPALVARRICVEAIEAYSMPRRGACSVEDASGSGWASLVDYATDSGAHHAVCVRSVPLPGHGVHLEQDEVLVCLRARVIHLEVGDLTEVSVHALLKIGHSFELCSPAIPFRVIAALVDEEWIDG